MTIKLVEEANQNIIINETIPNKDRHPNKDFTLHDVYCMAKLQEVTFLSMKRNKPIVEKPTISTNSYRPFYSISISL